MPSENTEPRKLAAILFTDMVGYSALSRWVPPRSNDLLSGKVRS